MMSNCNGNGNDIHPIESTALRRIENPSSSIVTAETHTLTVLLHGTSQKREKKNRKLTYALTKSNGTNWYGIDRLLIVLIQCIPSFRRYARSAASTRFWWIRSLLILFLSLFISLNVHSTYQNCMDVPDHPPGQRTECALTHAQFIGNSIFVLRISQVDRSRLSAVEECTGKVPSLLMRIDPNTFGRTSCTHTIFG